MPIAPPQSPIEVWQLLNSLEARIAKLEHRQPQPALQMIESGPTTVSGISQPSSLNIEPRGKRKSTRSFDPLDRGNSDDVGDGVTFHRYTSGSALDSEITDYPFTIGSYVTVAKITFSAKVANDELHFTAGARIFIDALHPLTVGTSGGVVADSIKWTILQDDTAALGAVITNITNAILGPYDFNFAATNSVPTLAGLQAVSGKPHPFVIADTNSHTYSLAIGVFDGGQHTITNTATTKHVSTAVPGSLLAVREWRV